MARFSERIGKRTPRSVIQEDSLDDQTRTELYNVWWWNLMEQIGTHTQPGYDLMKVLWTDHYHERTSDFSASTLISKVAQDFSSGHWYDVLDILEMTNDLVVQMDYGWARMFRDRTQQSFERYFVAARWVGEVLTPLGEGEAAAIEAAIEDGRPASAHHLQAALDLLAARPNPNHAKVVSEAVLAVEAAVRELTGKRDFTQALAQLEANGLPVHPAIRGAWSKLYGWSSDSAGIRHAALDGAEVDEALAIYMLTSASAFINMLTRYASKR